MAANAPKMPIQRASSSSSGTEMTYFEHFLLSLCARFTRKACSCPLRFFLGGLILQPTAEPVRRTLPVGPSRRKVSSPRTMERCAGWNPPCVLRPWNFFLKRYW